MIFPDFPSIKTEIKKMVKDIGPKAFCTGTILPCPAGTRCAHFGIHNCSTFKKHSKRECPHHAGQHDFKCIRLEEGDDQALTKEIEK